MNAHTVTAAIFGFLTGMVAGIIVASTTGVPRGVGPTPIRFPGEEVID